MLSAHRPRSHHSPVIANPLVTKPCLRSQRQVARPWLCLPLQLLSEHEIQLHPLRRLLLLVRFERVAHDAGPRAAHLGLAGKRSLEIDVTLHKEPSLLPIARVGISLGRLKVPEPCHVERRRRQPALTYSTGLPSGRLQRTPSASAFLAHWQPAMAAANCLDRTSIGPDAKSAIDTLSISSRAYGPDGGNRASDNVRHLRLHRPKCLLKRAVSLARTGQVASPPQQPEAPHMSRPHRSIDPCGNCASLARSRGRWMNASSSVLAQKVTSGKFATHQRKRGASCGRSPST
mmetsp:Transcript_57971/g.172337  ORF Transcript_57971/g.172337 Transcript_57971/m.172337 type:complete len:289 (+) Transcript_57971:69-935(+)